MRAWQHAQRTAAPGKKKELFKVIAVAAAFLLSGGAPLVAAGVQTSPRERPVAAKRLELVHAFRRQMPVGVAVTGTQRVFVSYPRWEDPVAFTLAEIKNGREVPYPSGGALQKGNEHNPNANLVSLQGILVDARDRLWVLDTGTINMRAIQPFVPKLVCIDTKTNSIVRTIKFGHDVVPPTSYLNDLRIDLKRGGAGTVYITDSGGQGPCGIIVVDIASGRTVRRLGGDSRVRPEPNFVGFVEGRALFRRPNPFQASHVAVGSDGIALSANGGRLFWCALSSRKLYSVPTQALADPAVLEDALREQVTDHGEKGTADGLCEDTANRIYITNWEQNAINRRLPSGLLETVVQDNRLLWPDTLDLARDGYLYVINNQLHRQGGYNGGRDLRKRPFHLWRIRVNARPVDLR